MRTLFITAVVLFAGCFLYACMEEPEKDLKPIELSINPNTIQSEFELGRVLFYDKNLSVNNSISCASCHKQAFAFADNVAFSSGFENTRTTRNSMPIQNLTGIGNGNNGFRLTPLFWDGRENDLQRMVLKPVVNHREMGVTDLDFFVRKLSEIDYYQTAFANIHGPNTSISLDHISAALAAFVGGITSVNTRFDHYVSTQEGLSGLELEGMRLFFEKYDCNSCHQVQGPSGYLFAGTFSNIGLDPVYEDVGLQNVTGVPSDQGKFKIPSLRNVVLTAPYMHDGRFQTLEEVIEHYSTGLTSNTNLDFRLKDAEGQPMVMNISSHEKNALIAFLKTLTDETMVTDPKLSNPFK